MPVCEMHCRNAEVISISCIKFSVKYFVYYPSCCFLCTMFYFSLLFLISFSELLHVRAGAAKVHFWLLLEQVSTWVRCPSCCQTNSIKALKSEFIVFFYSGKFKSSEGSFKADLLPISPQELLMLLQESECQEAVKGTQSNGIGDDDLKKLLDRSDLIAKWNSRLHGSNSGKYILSNCLI